MRVVCRLAAPRSAERLSRQTRPAGRWPLIAALVSAILVGGCSEDEPGPPQPEAQAVLERQPKESAEGSGAGPAVVFSEEAAPAGLDFVHFNGMSGEMYIAEMVGPGVALFDYDNDGDLDIYLVQGRMLGDKPLSAAVFPPGDKPLVDRLYRNDLKHPAAGAVSPADPPLHFTDVTEQAGLRVDGYGMGVAVGDYDRDGWPDLYVTQLGSNVLLRNRGDGSFEEVSRQAGVDDPLWGTSAMFVDVDADGWPDLFACNYVDFDPARRERCFDRGGALDYCGPKTYRPQPDRLWRNRALAGDAAGFVDITGSSGLARGYGSCLGALSADLNGDGRVDLYVANDGMDNLLWINQGGGRFVNDAALAGVAFNWEGMSEASMGVDAADFDNDGDEDLFLTHLRRETNTLYVNDGQGFFEDTTLATGLSAPSRAYTGFGTAWIDVDNDSLPDLFVANGEVRHIEALARAGDPYPLRQKNQLFRNLGSGSGEAGTKPRFREVSDRAGPVFALEEVSRAAAFGDLDNDGDLDLVVTNNAGPVRLLRNRIGNLRHWLGLRLLDPDTGLEVVGARVAILRRGQAPLWRRVRTAASYLAANDPRVLVGLGGDPKAPLPPGFEPLDNAARGTPAVEGVRVVWPDGSVEEWERIPVDTYTDLVRGTGRAVQTAGVGQGELGR
jgi:hypothetical protein